MSYMRLRTSCSLSFLSTFFSSKREVLLREESAQLENSLGREELKVDVETFLIWEMSLRKLKSSSILFIRSKYYSCLFSSQVYQIKFIDTITSTSSSVCKPATPINAVYVRLSVGVWCRLVCRCILVARRLSWLEWDGLWCSLPHRLWLQFFVWGNPAGPGAFKLLFVSIRCSTLCWKDPVALWRLSKKRQCLCRN